MSVVLKNTQTFQQIQQRHLQSCNKSFRLYVYFIDTFIIQAVV